MKRPHLVHFNSIMNSEHLSVKASVTLKENTLSSKSAPELINLDSAKLPYQALKLLNAYQFTIKLVGFNDKQVEVYKRSFESDSFGNFNFKIPLSSFQDEISIIQVYETTRSPGIDIHLGAFIPYNILDPKKIIICDFDKTLVDTKYSSPKEVYESLTNSIDHFPRVENSIDILKGYIEKGFHPFILSASPHFYEDSMRDWLYKNEIYTAGIFLKDYRQVFSFFDGDLMPKDLKVQGLYKLNHLLDILNMTGIPNELVLMGDNFESDPLIYMSMAMIIKDELDPWYIWNTFNKYEIFQFSKKQNSKILNKIYKFSSMINNQKTNNTFEEPKIDIFIRKKAKEESITVPKEYETYKALINLYDPNKQPQLTE